MSPFEKHQQNLFDTCSNLESFVEENKVAANLKKLLEEIKDGKKGLEVRKSMFKKNSSIEEEELLKWARKHKYAENSAQEQILVEALLKDFLVVKETKKNKTVYRMVDVKERRELKQKARESRPAFSLSWLMEQQKEEFPNLSIPILFHHLFSRIVEMGGKTSEGLFRLSISEEKKEEALKIILHKGGIDLSDETDPNVAAVLIKQTLKEIRPPILSGNFHSECLKADNDQKLEEIWKKLPKESQQFILHFSNFLSQFCQPQVVNQTRMNLDNFAIVFAPSLVSDPNMDPMTLVQVQPAERLFFTSFIHFLWKHKMGEMIPIDLRPTPLLTPNPLPNTLLPLASQPPIHQPKMNSPNQNPQILPPQNTKRKAPSILNSLFEDMATSVVTNVLENMNKQTQATPQPSTTPEEFVQSSELYNAAAELDGSVNNLLSLVTSGGNQSDTQLKAPAKPPLKDVPAKRANKKSKRSVKKVVKLKRSSLVSHKHEEVENLISENGDSLKSEPTIFEEKKQRRKSENVRETGLKPLQIVTEDMASEKPSEDLKLKNEAQNSESQAAKEVLLHPPQPHRIPSKAMPKKVVGAPSRKKIPVVKVKKMVKNKPKKTVTALQTDHTQSHSQIEGPTLPSTHSEGETSHEASPVAPLQPVLPVKEDETTIQTNALPEAEEKAPSDWSVVARNEAVLVDQRKGRPRASRNARRPTRGHQTPGSLETSDAKQVSAAVTSAEPKTVHHPVVGMAMPTFDPSKIHLKAVKKDNN